MTDRCPHGILSGSEPPCHFCEHALQLAERDATIALACERIEDLLPFAEQWEPGSGALEVAFDDALTSARAFIAEHKESPAANTPKGETP
jgi:hypothetical protein